MMCQYFTLLGRGLLEPNLSKQLEEKMDPSLNSSNVGKRSRENFYTDKLTSMVKVQKRKS